MNSKFKFSILTENGVIYNDFVNKVIVTTSEGEITVLKNHIPLIATTKEGRLIAFKDDKELSYLAKEGVLNIS